MKVRLCVAVLVLTFICHAQSANEVRFSGLAINMTNPNQPLAAPIELSVDSGRCRLTVSLPLGGSGACHVTSYDEKSGNIEFLSDGPPLIAWKGTIKGNLASGSYTINSVHENGTFYLALVKQPSTEPIPPPPPAYSYTPPTLSSCSPAIESSISGDFNGWEGETIFKLNNGQIWQQAEYDYEYNYDYNPEATIYETSAGCRMKVEGEEETVLVKRIK
jgi:hypothetical protein